MTRAGRPARCGAGRRRQRGSAVLYVIVLSPVLLLSLALAVQLGALQLEKERLRSALDEAVVVAASRAAAVDSAGAQVDGARAAALLRTSLDDNLRPLEDQIDGLSPEAVAAAAEVAVVGDVPALDPLGSGALLRRPTLEARVRIPVRTGLLAFAGLPGSVTLTLTTSADLRRTGSGST